MEKENNNKTIWESVFLILLVIGIIYFVYNYLFKKEVWTAYYERINDNRIYTSQEFSTAQECANWMNEQRALEAKTPTGKYNFECGLNCNPPTAINGPFVCNKTFDN